MCLSFKSLKNQHACLLSRFSRVRLFVTLWTVAHQDQALLSMGFSRHEYWRRLPFPSPGDLPNPQTKPRSLTSPALAGGFFTTEPRGKPPEIKKKREQNQPNKNLHFHRFVYRIVHSGIFFSHVLKISLIKK